MLIRVLRTAKNISVAGNNLYLDLISRSVFTIPKFSLFDGIL